MNPDAAKTVAECFLKGPFETVLSVSLDCEVKGAEAATGESLEALLSRYAVSMQGRLPDESGGLALLFTDGDAARFASALRQTEGEPAESLGGDDRDALENAVGALLSAGAAQLLELAGKEAAEVEGPGLTQGGSERAEALQGLIGGEAVVVNFSFQIADGASGEGALVYGETLERLVPGGGEGAATGTLSQEEMQDILSGFGEPEAAEAGMAADGGIPKNLDMVLDIQLEATARLGRVEMPIGEILSLGPGSIIEVGHLVDEPVELLINGRLVARGDVVQVDEKFGLRITEVISPQARIETLR